MPRAQHLLLLASLLAVVAGCANPDESTNDMGEEVNNLPQAQGTVEEGDDAGCTSTTTGEPTTDESANPCPQGQYPSG